MSTPTALVTGVSGFLGAHVVDALLKDGYRVRGTVRSANVELVKEGFAKDGDKVEIIVVNDFARDDFSHALEGVSAVIHVAAPMPGTTSAQEALNAAIDGTLNLMAQAEKAGVKQFVAVSSINTTHPISSRQQTEVRVTPDLWDEAHSREDALRPDAHPYYIVYTVEKVLAEKALWDFAEKHPHVEAATVNPPFFIGPMASGFYVKEPSMSAIGTNYVIYNLLHPDAPLTNRPIIIDARDIARACVLALKAPPTSEVGRKRFLLSAGGLPYKEAVEYIAQERPHLAHRLNIAAKSGKLIPPDLIDTSRAREVLGLEFTPWKKTLLDTVDYLVELEKDWIGKGWEPTKEFKFF